MWRLVAAAELPTPVDNTGAYTVLAGTIFTGLLALAGVIVSNRSKNRTEPSPPAPTGNGEGKLRERMAVAEADIVRLNGLAEDSEDRDELQDRRLDRIEARLDRLHRPKHGTEG